MFSHLYKDPKFVGATTSLPNTVMVIMEDGIEYYKTSNIIFRSEATIDKHSKEDEGLETGTSHSSEGTSHSGKKRATTTAKRSSSARAVSEEEAEALVTSANLSGRVETSARTGAGVREAFDFIAERVSERSDRRERRE